MSNTILYTELIYIHVHVYCRGIVYMYMYVPVQWVYPVLMVSLLKSG